MCSTGVSRVGYSPLMYIMYSCPYPSQSSMFPTNQMTTYQGTPQHKGGNPDCFKVLFFKLVKFLFVMDAESHLFSPMKLLFNMLSFAIIQILRPISLLQSMTMLTGPVYETETIAEKRIYSNFVKSLH